MKKFSFVAIFILFFSVAFSLTKKEPKWFSDIYSVYPSKNFICAMGNALDEPSAKNSALSELSRSFSVNVSSTLDTEFNEIASKGKSTVFQTISEKISSESNITLIGVQYSETFFNKKEKKYYSVAYIDRLKAWNFYANEAELSKSKFYSYYNKAQGQDPLNQFFWYSRAQTEGSAFLESLLMLSILDNSKTNSVYGSDKQAVASINSKKTSCLKQSKIFINANDSSYNDSLTQALSDLGFTVTKNKSEASYIASATINDNIESTGSGEDTIFTSYPSIDFSITHFDETVYTYNIQSKTKNAAYSKSALNKKVKNNIVELIKNDLKNNISTLGN